MKYVLSLQACTAGPANGLPVYVLAQVAPPSVDLKILLVSLCGNPPPPHPFPRCRWSRCPTPMKRTSVRKRRRRIVVGPARFPVVAAIGMYAEMGPASWILRNR